MNLTNLGAHRRQVSPSSLGFVQRDPGEKLDVDNFGVQKVNKKKKMEFEFTHWYLPGEFAADESNGGRNDKDDSPKHIWTIVLVFVTVLDSWSVESLTDRILRR